MEPVLAKACLPWPNLLTKILLPFILIVAERVSGHRVALLVFLVSVSPLAPSSDTTCRAEESTTPTEGWASSVVPNAANVRDVPWPPGTGVYKLVRP